jgi:formylglycine-generating enzyme required for sulfatase activity
MSTVFRARDLDSYAKEIVAVKVLNKAFSEMPDSIIALKRETAKCQQLAHPNVVNVRDYGQDGRHAYMWMELLVGPSLYERLEEVKGGGMPRSEALEYLRGMAEALKYAHTQRIIHSDFKPGNVMIAHNEKSDVRQTKVIDFGISRAAKNPDTNVTQETIFDPGVFGALTPSYASPEMLERETPDVRDDIYALACIAYEMFTGNHPFNRLTALQAKAGKMTLEPCKALTRQELRAIQHGLEFNRSDRTPNVAQFMEEFAQKDLRNYQVAGGVVVAAAVIYAIAVSDLFDRLWWEEPPKILNDCTNCPELVVVEAGSFRQGSDPQAPGHLQNEGPVRKVTVEEPFAMGRFEVTVAEFEAFALSSENRPGSGCTIYGEEGWTDSARASWRFPGFNQSPDHPVTCVSWQDAQHYVQWLSDRTGKSYRLPSASEWEYVARSPAASGFLSLAAETTCATANTPDQSAAAQFRGWATIDCNDTFVHTAPVGSLEPSEARTHDMLGNVFEWVEDCWNDSYRSAPTDGSAWLNGECSLRELRGGSWHSQAEVVRPPYRNRLPAETRSSSIGFRVVRNLQTED